MCAVNWEMKIMINRSLYLKDNKNVALNWSISGNHTSNHSLTSKIKVINPWMMNK